MAHRRQTDCDGTGRRMTGDDCAGETTMIAIAVKVDPCSSHLQSLDQAPHYFRYCLVSAQCRSGARGSTGRNDHGASSRSEMCCLYQLIILQPG